MRLVRTMAIVVISATIAFVRSNSRNAISTGMSTAVLTRATLARARALATGAAARAKAAVSSPVDPETPPTSPRRARAAMLALISAGGDERRRLDGLQSNHRKNADGDHQDERRQAPNSTGLHVEQ